MNTIESKSGMKWSIDEFDEEYCIFICPDCAFEVEKKKSNINDIEACPKCLPKPAAVKTDADGHCINLCEVGMVEYIHSYKENYTKEHKKSERAAVRFFLEVTKAHLPEDDPIRDKLTEESLLAKYRRLIGKKKDSDGPCGGPPHECNTKREKRYLVAPTAEAVEKFLDKYLPDYMLVLKVGFETEQQDVTDKTEVAIA